MKKLLSLLLICLLLTLASCREKDDGPSIPTPDEPAAEKVHIFVLAGQSGARGKALVSDLSDDDRKSSDDVFILADGLPMGELNNIPSVDDSLYIDVLEPGYGDFPSEFGPEIGMGQTLASVYPKLDADYKTVIVKYTASGSTITDHWYSGSAVDDPELADHINLDQSVNTDKGDETGPLTKNLYDLVNMAIAEVESFGYEAVVEGMAFVHGEQDAKFDENMEIYEKALGYFISDFRAYFESPDMPVVITEALTNSAKHSNRLREIQASVAEKMNNVSLINTWDLYTNTFEPWHFGAQSNNILGNRIAAELASYNETREVVSIDENIIDVPLGTSVELPSYVKASFTNGYSGYLKVLEYSSYDLNLPGEQNVSFKARTASGVKEFDLRIKVSADVAYVDGVLNEYSGAKKNTLPGGLGEVYVVKGDKGFYVAARINDADIWTDGENWHRGDMGQKGNNDDFRIYVTDSSAEDRITICLSAANLLRVYGKGISLSDSEVTLEFGNQVYKKQIEGYKYHVTTYGTVNGAGSTGMCLEFYISYAELGINADDIMLCFNYSDVSSDSGIKSETDNYLTATSGNEENDDSYFAIGQLVN